MEEKSIPKPETSLNQAHIPALDFKTHLDCKLLREYKMGSNGFWSHPTACFCKEGDVHSCFASEIIQN